MASATTPPLPQTWPGESPTISLHLDDIEFVEFTVGYPNAVPDHRVTCPADEFMEHAWQAVAENVLHGNGKMRIGILVEDAKRAVLHDAKLRDTIRYTDAATLTIGLMPPDLFSVIKVDVWYDDDLYKFLSANL